MCSKAVATAQYIFLLAGQSNATGQGNHSLSNLRCYSKEYEYDVLLDSIKPLQDPVGQMWKSLQPANTGSILPAFATTFSSLVDKKIIVVTASRGGSSCSEKAELADYGTWDTPGRLFVDATEKTNRALKKANASLNGIIWMQGERDANAINDGKLDSLEFKSSLVNLIARFRQVYGSSLPFYIVQTGYQKDRPKLGNDAVRNMQLIVSKELNNVFIVYTDTESFFENKWMKDHVHYNQDGLNHIGSVIATKIFYIISSI